MIIRPVELSDEFTEAQWANTPRSIVPARFAEIALFFIVEKIARNWVDIFRILRPFRGEISRFIRILVYFSSKKMQLERKSINTEI